MENEFVCKVLNNIKAFLLEFFNVEIFNALMISKFSPGVFLIANLAHNKYFRAIILDVIMKLSSCQMLELFPVANITSELRAVELSMSLKFTQSFPYNFSSSISMALVREFTKVDTVFKDLIYFLHKVSSSLTVWTTNIIVWSNTMSYLNMRTSSISSS